MLVNNVIEKFSLFVSPLWYFYGHSRHPHCVTEPKKRPNEELAFFFRPKKKRKGNTKWKKGTVQKKRVEGENIFKDVRMQRLIAAGVKIDSSTAEIKCSVLCTEYKRLETNPVSPSMYPKNAPILERIYVCPAGRDCLSKEKEKRCPRLIGRSLWDETANRPRERRNLIDLF